MVTITKTSDVKYQYVNILLFGESGSGKTHFLGTAKENETIIFNIVSESGLLTLRNKNIDVIEIKDFNDMSNALDWLEKEGCKKYKYVGIDSFSQFQKNLEKQSTKKGFDLWGDIKIKTKAVVDRLKAIQINVIAICEVEIKDDDGAIKFIPSLVGTSSKNEISYWFDEVYWFEKTGKAGDKPTYRALTNSGSKYPCKSRLGCLPLVIENPNIPMIFESLSKEATQVEAGQKKSQKELDIELITQIAIEKHVLIEKICETYQVKKLEDMSDMQRLDCFERLKRKAE